MNALSASGLAVRGPDDAVPSLWDALAAPASVAAPLSGDARCDVVVVGAGFLGLSTALHLAEGGAAVRIIEAHRVGAGASGRNTGFVVPSLKFSFGPDDVAARIGAPAAERLLALVGGSGDGLFDLVRRHRLACAAEQTGWMQPASTPAAAALLERRARDWAALGRDARLLDRDAVAGATGLPGYHGALLFPSGGQLNPLAYARELARAAQGAGAVLHEGTPATRLDRRGSGWAVSTPGGAITCERVLLATNALVGALVPAVRDSLIPARAYQIASQVLPPSCHDTILPTRSSVSDTRRHTFAVRWSPDGRLVTGGVVIQGPLALRRAAHRFAWRLEGFFPSAGPLRAEHAWSGVIATRPDWLPVLFELGPGLDAAIGCNGRGVALTTAFGAELAAHYAGRVAREALSVPIRRPQPIPWRLAATIGPSVWLPWSELRDWIDGRA